MTSKMVEERSALCESVDLEDEEHSCWNGAVNTVGAVWLTLQAVHGDAVENAARAAENVLNDIDEDLVEELVGPSAVLEPRESADLRKKVFDHPVTRAEIERQEQLLEFLATHTDLAEQDVVFLRS